jgi:hypothetical protein
MASSSKQKTMDPLCALQKEFKLYEARGVRTPNLDKLDAALKTIQPTSTLSKRTFSVAGKFYTKLRNRMEYPLLNVER